MVLGTLFFCFAGHSQVEIPARIDHQPWNELLQKYVNKDGLVDYERWNNHKQGIQKLKEYLEQFEESPEESAQGNHLIASLINAYNAFTIKLILDNYPTESIRLLDNPFKEKRNKVGGNEISLDQIEHDLLRPLIGLKVQSDLGKDYTHSWFRGLF